jgi:hypothetical protein
MDFKQLHETIPYAKGGKEKVLTYSPYPNINLAMPGRHALDTIPIGGDFVVMVTDSIFDISDHQFTHTDLFKDVEARRSSEDPEDKVLMEAYLKVIQGADPASLPIAPQIANEICMDRLTFIRAVQCLAVAEHRRYAKYENKFGGRYLPFRFAAGIDEGLWTAADAAGLQRKGRPGVEILEKQYGVPKLTQELMG